VGRRFRRAPILLRTVSSTYKMYYVNYCRGNYVENSVLHNGSFPIEFC
jgi:hypothetical protein